MSDRLSDKQPRQATDRITVRVPHGDLVAFDESAERAGATRSELFRTLLALPIEFDMSSIRRTVHGDGSLEEPLRDDLALTAGDPPFEVVAITDKALAGIRSECRSIGVNYNQSVRALNTFLRKYGSHRSLSEAERKEITDMYKRIAKQNKVIYERIKGIESTLDEIEAAPSVNLTARAATAELPPENKTDASDRPRHRTRGRRHGGGEVLVADTATRAVPYTVPSALERPLEELTGQPAAGPTERS